MTIPKSYEALAADLASEKILSKTLQGQKEAYMILADQLKLDLATWKQKACEAAEREAALREELSQYEPASTGTASKRARWLINIQDACKYGLPKHLVQRLNNTTKEIQNSIKFGGTKRLRDENESLQQRLTVAERRESEAREELLELSRKLDAFYSRSHGIKNLSEIEKANDKAKYLKLKVCEYEVLLNISKELLTTISRHGATTKPVDWCDSFKAEVADRIEKIGAALKPAAEDDSDLQKIGFVRMNTKTDQPRISLADMQARYEDKP